MNELNKHQLFRYELKKLSFLEQNIMHFLDISILNAPAALNLLMINDLSVTWVDFVLRKQFNSLLKLNNPTESRI